jgi:hypothetical protein
MCETNCIRNAKASAGRQTVDGGDRIPTSAGGDDRPACRQNRVANCVSTEKQAVISVSTPFQKHGVRLHYDVMKSYNAHRRGKFCII